MVENATPTPRWCEQDYSVGYHNSRLAESTIRILEGATWKKQDTILLLPAAKMVPMKCAITWMHLMSPPNQAFHKIPLLGMEVGEAYSTAIEQILAHPQLSQCKYILTLEHDNTVPQDGLLKLIKRMDEHPELACIGGLYWTKGPAGVPQIWGDPTDPVINFRPQAPNPQGGLVECCGTGMGFNLWRLDMFKDARLRRPWFRTLATPTEGVGTQDLYFWGDARKHGYRCGIDCSVTVGHYDIALDLCW